MTGIHAICLAKNEGDVIAETLQFASNFCHKIYVFDPGSIDDTWQLSLDTDLRWDRYISPSKELNYYNNVRIFQIRLDERIAIFKQRFGIRDFFRFDFLAR